MLWNIHNIRVVNFSVTDIIYSINLLHYFFFLKDEDIGEEINESGNENTEATSNNGTHVNAEPNDSDVAEAGCSSASPTSKNVPKFHTTCKCNNCDINVSSALDDTIMVDTAM